MVRRKHFIGMLLLGLLAVAACTQKPQVVEPVETPSPELSAIDSLLWHQPDSALACLLPCFDTCIDTKFCISTATAYNRHYANLLLSELLYKNDYAQVNRRELLQAVNYFDSLCCCKDVARNISTIAFLDARAHYINGVGYYENDSVVEACAEYLKTLEVMESHFEEKDLVGHKARFMAFTYNRLGDLFSEQFMMESAIDSYENALVFCKIEPTSPQGVSNILYRLGKQYDKMGEKTKASDYYEQAILGLPNNNSLLFRDLVSTKALCDYQLGYGFEQSLYTLKHILTQADNESECLFRFLTIGGIYFEETIYDSALFYLEPVFENGEAFGLQSETVNYLHIIYDSLGEKEKADACVRFLAKNKKLDWENKTLVSKLEDLFKNYQNHKQKKQADEERRKSIQKTIWIIVPIAVLVVLVIYIQIKLRGKKLLKQQQAKAEKALENKEKHHQQEIEAKEAQAKKELEERDKRHADAIEAERQTHKMQQAALSGRLKRSNEELRDVSNQLEQMLAKNVSSELVLSDDYKAFVNTPICHYIVNLVHTQQFKSKMDYLIYKDNALSKEQLLALRDAAETNLPRFVSQIRKQFPKLTDNDMDYCYLFLLGLNEADISALMQRAYTTVCDRSRKISRIIGTNDSLYQTLRNMLYEN